MEKKPRRKSAASWQVSDNSKKWAEKHAPPAGTAPAGSEFSLPVLSAPNSRLGQAEKSQNSPSENVPKTQKNPAEIGRFQPDLVGVSGFEPEASWSRTKRDTKLRHTPKA